MKSFLKHLHLFAKNNEITREEMKDIVLTWNEPFRIYSRKKDGRRIYRDVFSFAGPSTAPLSPKSRYDYDQAPYNYMILYDLDRDGYRTFLMDEMYKIVKDGKTYILK